MERIFGNKRLQPFLLQVLCYDNSDNSDFLQPFLLQGNDNSVMLLIPIKVLEVDEYDKIRRKTGHSSIDEALGGNHPLEAKSDIKLKGKVD